MKKNKLKEFSLCSNNENINSSNNANYQEIEFIGIPKFFNNKNLKLKKYSIDKSIIFNETSGILSQTELNDSKIEQEEEKGKLREKDENNKFSKQFNFFCQKIGTNYTISTEVLFDLEVDIQKL